MKNDIKSQSTISTIGTTSKQFIIPSVLQLLLYVLIGILLLISLNIKHAWDYLNAVVLAPEGGLDSIVADKAPLVHTIINKLSQSVALQFIFWLFVGCAIYIIFWFIKNIFVNLRNDMVADKFIHPAGFKRDKYWESVIARKIFFWFSLALLVFLAVAGFGLLVSLAGLCYTEITHFKSWHSSVQLIEAVAALTGLIYVLVLLAHLVLNSWQVLYKDL